MAGINCPHCGEAFNPPDGHAPQYAGRMIVCARCRQRFVVPGAAPRGPITIAYAVAGYEGPKQPNDAAVASFWVALFGIIIPVIPGIAAIVLGIKGLARTRNREVGGTGLAVAGITVGTLTLLLSSCLVIVIVTAVRSEWETANRIKCGANIRLIGTALYAYANSNDGQFPPRLEDLLLTQDIKSDAFICPGSGDTPAEGATPQARAAAMSSGGHNSYIYVPGLGTSASADTVVLYEPVSDHHTCAMVLYGDGHVECNFSKQIAGIAAEIKAGHNPPRPGHY